MNYASFKNLQKRKTRQKKKQTKQGQSDIKKKRLPLGKRGGKEKSQYTKRLPLLGSPAWVLLSSEINCH